MKLAFSITFLLIVGLILEAMYIRTVRAQTEDISRRLDALAQEVGRLPEGAQVDGEETHINSEAQKTHSAARSLGLMLSAMATESSRQDLRRLIDEQLEVRRVEQEQRLQQREQLANRAGSVGIARDLDLSANEIARLQELGEPINEIRRKESQGDLGPLAARDELVRASRLMEADLKQLLGPDRYKKIADIRRDHPEYGRSFTVLQVPYESIPSATPNVQASGEMNPPQETR